MAKIDERRERVIEQARFLVRYWKSLPDIPKPRRGIFGMDSGTIVAGFNMLVDQFLGLESQIRQLSVAVQMLDEIDESVR